MATIETLMPDFLSLDRDSQMKIILQVRQSRRERKVTKVKAVAKRRDGKKKVYTMLDGMSKSELDVLAKMLEEKDES